MQVKVWFACFGVEDFCLNGKLVEVDSKGVRFVSDGNETGSTARIDFDDKDFRKLEIYP